jgi:hypothetical protein
MIVDASRASTLPAPKGLGDRIQTPKSQPKSAANTKATAGAAKGEGARRGRGRPSKRGGKSARPAKKTAEELDSEMMDYFGTAEAPAETGTAAPAQAAVANGDAMDDEVLVSRLRLMSRFVNANLKCSDQRITSTLRRGEAWHPFKKGVWSSPLVFLHTLLRCIPYLFAGCL